MIIKILSVLVFLVTIYLAGYFQGRKKGLGLQKGIIVKFIPDKDGKDPWRHLG